MKKLKSWTGLEAATFPFYILIILLLAVFAMGGSSRSDVESLIILRPLYIIGAGIAICTLTADHFQKFKYLIFLIILFLILHLLYLLPIFSNQENSLNKFQYFDRSLKVDRDLYHAIALDPEKTINSIFSIFLPISVILFVIQLRPKEHLLLLKFVLTFGCLSGIFGFFQIVGINKNLFYLYEISNLGSSVGLFANRNHQSVFLGLLLPMLATYASWSSRSDKNILFRDWVAISGSALIIPLILITGSRGGLLIGILAIAVSYYLYRKNVSTQQKSRRWRVLGALFGVIGVGIMTVIMSRAEAWDRLFDDGGDGRSGLWASTVPIMGKYFPFGTGPGGFSVAFKSSENLAVLDPTYLNHAHNDLLEWVVTFGLPGLMFMLIAITLFFFSVVRKWKDPAESHKSRLLLKLGVSIIMLIAFASVGDYPLRTPIFSCIFAIALCWTMGTNMNDRPTEATLPSRFLDGNGAASRTIEGA